MKKVNSKLKLCAGLVALAISSTAFGSGSNEEPAQNPTVDKSKCPKMKKYKGSDYHIDIIVDKEGKVSLEPNSYRDIWNNDTLSWKILNTPWQRDKKGEEKTITGVVIEFAAGEGFCDGWVDGKAETPDKKPKETISCKVRDEALSPYLKGQHGKGKHLPQTAYFYSITVKLKDGNTIPFRIPLITTWPSTGGNGCGSCHADTRF